MAGQPRRQAILRELEKRTRKRFDQNEQGERTILDYVCDWVASGNTLIKLTDEVGAVLRFDVQRSVIPALLRDMFGTTESNTRLSEARSHASHVLAEESLTLLDVTQSDMIGTVQARDRSKARQWIAGAWNREQYGSTKAVQIAIAVGDLHLDALRARQAGKAVAAGQAAAIESLQSAPKDTVAVDALDVEVVDK